MRNQWILTDWKEGRATSFYICYIMQINCDGAFGAPHCRRLPYLRARTRRRPSGPVYWRPGLASIQPVSTNIVSHGSCKHTLSKNARATTLSTSNARALSRCTCASRSKLGLKAVGASVPEMACNGVSQSLTGGLSRCGLGNLREVNAQQPGVDMQDWVILEWERWEVPLRYEHRVYLPST